MWQHDEERNREVKARGAKRRRRDGETKRRRGRVLKKMDEGGVSRGKVVWVCDLCLGSSVAPSEGAC